MALIEALRNIGFNWPVALANLVNFLIIFYLLKRFAFKPIDKVLTKRERTIREGLENAAKAKRDAMMAGEDRARILAEAQDQGNQIVMAAGGRADALVNEAEAIAKQKQAAILTEARRLIEKDKQAKERQVRQASAELIVSGLEKVLRENFDAKQQEGLIKKIAGSS